jgi:hypothetical protein
MNFLDYIFCLMFCNCRVATQTHSEYLQVETGVEYYSSNSSSTIDQLSSIPTLITCGMKCMENDQCLTATFYSTYETCYLFKAGALTNPVNNGSATIITMINRRKLMSFLFSSRKSSLLPTLNTLQKRDKEK